MNRISETIEVSIRQELCNGCGLCIKVCPARALALKNDRALLTGVCDFACDHCAAICPQGAITVDFGPRADFSKIGSRNQDSSQPVNPADLVSLLRRRRSCRNFTSAPLSRHQLEELVNIGITAPSGTNSQAWTFTLIDSREKMLSFGRRVGYYFLKLNRLAAKKWLRRLLALLGRPQLENYFQNYHDSIAEGLRLWRREGRDLLFHGAPAAILIGSRPGASCPKEDALLAAGNIILAAETMGLGSCLIGFAVEALKRDRNLARSLKIPAAETVYAVIALGYPALRFQRPAGRRRPEIRLPD